jgi:hypothetical protein
MRKIKNFFLVGFPIQNLDETLAFANYKQSKQKDN